MTDRGRHEEMSEEDLRRKLANGELSDEEFQEQMRRRAASRDPEDLPDSTDTVSVEGFGSGQGMTDRQTGQDPEIPDERGFPRTQDKRWPRGQRSSSERVPASFNDAVRARRDFAALGHSPASPSSSPTYRSTATPSPSATRLT